jgi:uncharacterized membrane protein YfcA
LTWALLATIGLAVGTFGTLIGAAGGFILVPVLLFLYPHETPANITGITLAVAFFNALSGSVAYARLRRIDFRSGLMFSVVAVPGAIIGASITSTLDRGTFELIFGSILLIVAVYLTIRPMRKAKAPAATRWHVVRMLTDSHGETVTYSFNRILGISIAFGVGVLSGLLGIGGGIIHVPALTQLLSFPVHIATATSQFVVATSTLAASISHAFAGSFTRLVETAFLSAGAIAGAQIGARLSRRIPGTIIVRLLAGALAIVAVRLWVDALW